MKNNQPVRLVIKINSSAVPNACPLCDKQTNPNLGCELFVDGTDQIVCFDCALLTEPLLASMVNMADAARFFARYEEENNSIWETVRRREARQSKGALVTFPQHKKTA
jgi:hypothetical protein